jgi:hypothetical protein
MAEKKQQTPRRPQGSASDAPILPSVDEFLPPEPAVTRDAWFDDPASYTTRPEPADQSLSVTAEASTKAGPPADDGQPASEHALPAEYADQIRYDYPGCSGGLRIFEAGREDTCAISGEHISPGDVITRGPPVPAEPGKWTSSRLATPAEITRYRSSDERVYTRAGEDFTTPDDVVHASRERSADDLESEYQEHLASEAGQVEPGTDVGVAAPPASTPPNSRAPRARPLSLERTREINRLAAELPESAVLTELAAAVASQQLEHANLSDRDRSIQESVQQQIALDQVSHQVAALAYERAEREGRGLPTVEDLNLELDMLANHAKILEHRERDMTIDLGEHSRLLNEATRGARRSTIAVGKDGIEPADELPGYGSAKGEIDRLALSKLPGLGAYLMVPDAARIAGAELIASDGSRMLVSGYDPETDTVQADVVDADGNIEQNQLIRVSDLEPQNVRQARAWAESVPTRAITALQIQPPTQSSEALADNDPRRRDPDISRVLNSPDLPPNLREQAAAALAPVVEEQRQQYKQQLAVERDRDAERGTNQESQVTAQINPDFAPTRLGSLHHTLDPTRDADRPLAKWAEQLADQQALRDEALKEVDPAIDQLAARIADTEIGRQGRDVDVDTIDKTALALTRHQQQYFQSRQTVAHKLARVVGLEEDTPTTGLEAMGISAEQVEQNKDMLAAAATYRGEEIDEDALQREAETLTFKAHVQEDQQSLAEQYEKHQARLARHETFSQVDHKGLINSAHEKAGQLIDPSKAHSKEGKAFAEVGRALAFFGIVTGAAVVKGAQAAVQLREQKRQREQARADVQVPQHLLDEGYTKENYADIRAMVRADAWRQHQDGLRDSPEPTQLEINDSAEFDLQYRQLVAEAEAQRQQELAEQLAHDQQLREQELQGPSLERSI